MEETSKDRQEEELAKLAHKLGYEKGRNAGSWVFDGNTTEETYRWFLKGLEDGDPEVIDRLPTSPLSGEWADSYSLADLASDLDVSQEDDDLAIARVESYRDAGILTNNEGIVVELTDGSQFQVTIVRSRP